MTSRFLLEFETVPRLHAKALRQEAFDKRPDAGVHAAANFMRAIAPPQEAIISVYYPIGSELDTWPLVEALLQQLNIVCLPVVLGKNMPLIFRQFTLETVLVPGMLNIDTPPDDAMELIPDIVVAPLLAFRRNGTRLGMGGGYYDRTLNMLRETGQVTAVGYSFGDQEMPHLTAQKHDEPLDWIITEREAIKAG